ncbi:ATP-binding protein [Kitasatospora nipponensis]
MEVGVAGECAGQRHLVARLRLVEQRVRRAVQVRREGESQPDDPFRGLYLSEEAVERILRTGPLPEGPADPTDPTDPDGLDDPDGPDGPADAAEAAAVEQAADLAELAGADLPLRRLAATFGLTPLEVELLLVALLPDTDPRFGQLYGYLNDDVTRRRASVGLALELVGAGPLHRTARAALAPGSALRAGGLLLMEETEQPFLARPLRVPDRVTAHLLGDDTAHPDLLGLIETPTGVASAQSAALGGALRAGAGLVYLREEPGGCASALAAAALADAHRHALRLDLAALLTRPAPQETLATLTREARLIGAGLIAGPVDALTPEHTRLLRRLTALPVTVLLTGRCGWDPFWSGDSPLQLNAAALTAGDRAALWTAALEEDELDPGLDASQALGPYLLTPDQIRRAARAARRQCLLDGGGPVRAGHLRAGVRAQNAAGLERLARRVEPAVGWDDLVLPSATTGQLAELALRARHRDQVLGTWRMRPGGGRGRGVMALFAGDSGTGKTMSAEVIAADLGLDLYVVDLSTVVDKYVGETEKNLERIFTEAAGVNGVLLFDEADAVFGKRSEVKDAHDRYANMESAYLLQRMESFDGIAVLTTNLRANLDEAFTRRLDGIVDFPVPQSPERRRLWDRCLGPLLPRGADLDLDFCARFELAGGSIRACAVTAAYRAAEAGRPLGTPDLVEAVRREYRKLGRLVLDQEFAPYL